MKRFLIVIFAVLFSFSWPINAATDPFSPKSTVMLWLNSKTDVIVAESLLRQAGFTGVSDDNNAKALITNKETLTESELTKMQNYISQGGKVIALGTKNIPDITFLGEHDSRLVIAYLQILDENSPKTIPKVVEFPRSNVSIFSSDGKPLLSYLGSDGYSKVHIEQLNYGLCSFSWGLYSGFDWFNEALLEDLHMRQLMIFWLRKTIWG